MIPTGWKTYTAAILTALVAFEQSLDAAGVGFVPEAVEQLVLTIAAALGLWGVRSAIATEAKAAAQAVAMVQALPGPAERAAVKAAVETALEEAKR